MVYSAGLSAGALLWAKVDQEHWLGAGAPETVNVMVRAIYLSSITIDRGINVAYYAGADELLASGYLREENRKQLAYKPFMVVQPHGRGLVIAFTADPNFRGYMDGLNTLFLNAVFRAPGHTQRLVPAEHGLSQEQLASLVGVTRQTVSAIETGLYCPSGLLVFLISNQLEKRVDELFFLKVEAP